MNTSETLNEITGCEVCGGKKLTEVLDLGRHPMCDDLVPVGDQRRCREYPITIMYCATCNTAHQKYQIPKGDLFPKTYHYRSRFTADVLNGMRTLVEDVMALEGIPANATVLDVGCNDGSLLDFFRAKGCQTIGVEPTGASADAVAKGHRVYDNFFTPELAQRIKAESPRIDIITFTNVFAHIEDLGSVLRAIKEIADKSTILVVENHYLGAVLDGVQFDTFYHEHPRTYSLSSFDHIARHLGMEIISCLFPIRYGGNIRVTMCAQRGSAELNVRQLIESKQEGKFGDRLMGMKSDIAHWKTRKLAALRAAVERHGPLIGKAFPGRAAILVKLLGIDVETIAAVHEKPGSIKIGHYVPGTRIPIVSDDDMPVGVNAPALLVNMAWHISGEIRGYLKQMGFSGEIIDIFSRDDIEP